MNISLLCKLFSSIVLCGMLGTASAYQLTGAKWPSNIMKFDYNLLLNGYSTSPSGISWNQAFEDAAEGWSSQTNFNIVTDTSDPSHPCAGVGSFPFDGFRNGAAFHHELCFQGQVGYEEEFGDRVLAVTITYSYTDAPEEIIETDLFFNDAESWDVYDGALRTLFDLKRVAMHEMGHVLGLDHEDTITALMQSLVSDLYTLQADDIMGVAALYGPMIGQDLIAMSIEEPFVRGVQSGISTFRGWVVSLYDLSSLKLYLNGSYKGELDHNGPRNDVCAIYGDYPNCAKSGFAFAFNYGLLSAGNNTYRLVARDVLGNVLEKSVTFSVARFDDAFVADPDEVSVANALVNIDRLGEKIVIDNLLHNGKTYSIDLKWRSQSQSFAPTSIQRK